jgi:hypothetical protein
MVKSIERHRIERGLEMELGRLHVELSELNGPGRNRIVVRGS